VWTLAILLLLCAGIVYRITAHYLRLAIDTTVELPLPLSVFPAEIGGWSGQDTPIPYNIQRVAGNDDFLSRLYTNRLTKEWVNIYIAYSARPRTMLGHKPEVCYVGSGWVLENTEPSKVISLSGTTIPCLVHRFHKPAPDNEEIVVLNFYILNGQITSDESGFSGVGWRTPNVAGNLARYVAQIQISSALENSVRSAAKDMTDLVLDFFPDKSGNVRAAKRVFGTQILPAGK
jgi:EpsI family protein